MRYLILSIHPKCMRFVEYCQKNDIDFIIVDAYSSENELNPNVKFLDGITIDDKNILKVSWDNFYNPETYIEIEFDRIINFRDNIKWVGLENQIYENLHGTSLFDKTTFDYISKKSAQEKLHKHIGIPYIGDDGDRYVVKVDAGESGGTGYYICDAKDYQPKEGDFIQTYQNIDGQIGIHSYIDNDGRWHVYTYCYQAFQNNCPIYTEVGAYDIAKRFDIEKYIPMIKEHVKLKNRLIFWQFMITTDGDVFPIDFNSRPSGAFRWRSTDIGISDFDACESLHTGKIPSVIHISSKVYTMHRKKQAFGWTPYDIKKVDYFFPVEYKIPIF